MIRRPPRSTRVRSSAASDVYKRQALSQAPALAEREIRGGVPERIREHSRGPPRACRLLRLLQPAAPAPGTRRPDPGRGLLVYTTDGTNSCMTSGQSPMNLMKLSRRTRPPLRASRLRERAAAVGVLNVSR